MKLEDNLNSLERVSALAGMSSVNYDLITSICGEFIGSGAFRSVFEYNLDPKYVVKIEPLNSSCNITEYQIYQEVHHLKGDLAWVKDWFVPVKWISPNGRILVMRKTTFFGKGKERPLKIPSFLWDVKLNNFGWLKGKFMCHDYGQFHAMTGYPKKFKKAPWDTKEFVQASYFE